MIQQEKKDFTVPQKRKVLILTIISVAIILGLLVFGVVSAIKNSSRSKNPPVASSETQPIPEIAAPSEASKTENPENTNSATDNPETPENSENAEVKNAETANPGAPSPNTNDIPQTGPTSHLFSFFLIGLSVFLFLNLLSRSQSKL